MEVYKTEDAPQPKRWQWPKAMGILLLMGIMAAAMMFGAFLISGL